MIESDQRLTNELLIMIREEFEKSLSVGEAFMSGRGQINKRYILEKYDEASVKALERFESIGKAHE